MKKNNNKVVVGHQPQYFPYIGIFDKILKSDYFMLVDSTKFVKKVWHNRTIIKDKKNKNGDIEIKEIGLRSGEKMYEELLVDAKAIKTNHPLIYKAFDKFIKPNNLLDILKNLDKLIESNKTEQAILIMKSLVPEYKKLD